MIGESVIISLEKNPDEGNDKQTRTLLQARLLTIEDAIGSFLLPECPHLVPSPPLREARNYRICVR
jgi:hypothetical protein